MTETNTVEMATLMANAVNEDSFAAIKQMLSIPQTDQASLAIKLKGLADKNPNFKEFQESAVAAVALAVKFLGTEKGIQTGVKAAMLTGVMMGLVIATEMAGKETEANG